MGTEVGAAAGEGDAADGCCAGEAGLSGAPVDAVFQLEEAARAVGIDVIGDGGASELDGVAENIDKRGAQAGQLGSGEAGGLAGGADGGAEERLVGVDVADAVQERLIEQRGLDRRAARMEEGDEAGERDSERFAAGAGEGCWLLVAGCWLRGVEGDAAEAARIDEAEFTAGCFPWRAAQGEDGVGVGREGDFGRGDEEATGHAEVDEEFDGCFTRSHPLR